MYIISEIINCYKNKAINPIICYFKYTYKIDYMYIHLYIYVYSSKFIYAYMYIYQNSFTILKYTYMYICV